MKLYFEERMKLYFEEIRGLHYCTIRDDKEEILANVIGVGRNPQEAEKNAWKNRSHILEEMLKTNTSIMIPIQFP